MDVGMNNYNEILMTDVFQSQMSMLSDRRFCEDNSFREGDYRKYAQPMAEDTTAYLAELKRK